MKSNGVKEDELSEENKKEWQRLKEGQITDPDQLVAIETKVKQNIYQKEVEKKITDLTSRVNEVLKSKNKSQIAALKKELLEFISSSNIYYSNQRKAAENLLVQLENYSIANNDQNSSAPNPTSPWKLVIPLLLIGALLILLIIVAKRIIRRKRK